jgi:hypothetical protein
LANRLLTNPALESQTQNTHASTDPNHWHLISRHELECLRPADAK